MAPRGASNWRRPYTSIYNDNYRYGTGLYSDTLSDIEKRYSSSISKTQLRSDRPDLTFTTFSGSNLTSSPAPVGESSGRENPVYSRQISSPMPEITRSPTFESRLNATLKSAAYALDENVDDVINSRIEKRKALAKSVSEALATDTEDEEDFRRRMEVRKQALAKALSDANATETEEDDSFQKRLEIRKRALARSTSEVQTKSSDSEEYVSKSKKTTSEESTKPTSLYDDASLWTLPKTSNKLLGLDLDNPKSKRKAGGRQTPTNGPSSSQWRDRSRDLQGQVDSLEKSMSDGSTRLRSELSSLKSKYHSELTDLSGSVENTTQQATDLQRLCKRQANQLEELQSAYGSAQRNIQDVLEDMTVWQNKCKSLKKEMDRLREEVELAVNKRSKA